MKGECVCTTTCPSCLNCETLRDELIENCGNLVNITFCCCESTLHFVGTVRQVGSNFVELNVDSTFTGTAPAVVVIPLKRIVSVNEITLTGNELCQVGDCGSCENFRDELNDFCGQCVTVFWCACDVVAVTTGVLNEIGANFIELSSVVGSTFGFDGTDMVISLGFVCAVEKFLVAPTGPCPTPTPLPTAIPG